MTETTPEVLRDFACSCSDEGKTKLKALRDEVCKALDCEPDSLVSAVVYDLNWEHAVGITGVPCDMWSAVKSEYTRFMTDEEAEEAPEDASDWVVEAAAYIECDRIEDGFALTWKTWNDWFKNRGADSDTQ